MCDLDAPNVKFHILVLSNALGVLEERLTGPDSTNPSAYLQEEAIIALSECRAAISALNEGLANKTPALTPVAQARKRA